jgi:hypothetical protein
MRSFFKWLGVAVLIVGLVVITMFFLALFSIVQHGGA